MKSVVRANNSRSPGLSKQQAAFLELLGPPPVMEGEDLTQYQRLLMAIVEERKPKTMPDWISIRDIVDNQWELQRYRGALVTLHNSVQIAAKDLVEKHKIFGPVSPQETIEMKAKALGNAFGTIKAVDLLMANKEQRRDNAHFEIDRRRAVLAKTPRDSAEAIEDVEFRVLEDQTGEERAA